MACFNFCNPFCGRCRPATKKMCACPDCGKTVCFDRAQIVSEVVLRCPECGVDMTAAVVDEPRTCNYSGLMCDFPCGRSYTGCSESGYQPCAFNVRRA